MKKNDKIHINLNYGTGVSVLPASSLAYIDKAKKFDIKVLLLLASSDRYRMGKYEELIAGELGCEVSDVKSSISFWNGTGVISIEDFDEDDNQNKKTQTKANTKIAKKENKKVKPVENSEDEEIIIPKRAKVSELPQYTSAELNALLTKHKNVLGLIDECQNILGKMFTAADIKVLMSFVDYLGLDNDYILVLMHYAARNDMKSLRFIEKIAISCIDEGYTDAKTLQQALYAKEEKVHIESKIKKMFGFGTRQLTSKEQSQVDTWVLKYHYGLDIIEKAYEFTIAGAKEPSIPYTHAILERWFVEGVKNIDDVNALIAIRDSKKATDGSSFDVDDFFAAALKRSYSEE